mmetsp:Transcript_32296/g.62415  ORF Transcript_32296/g.62415 Transcript_32296/m.62415 type:complete len:82 (-) Transcript_32296:7-252(-)
MRNIAWSTPHDLWRGAKHDGERPLVLSGQFIELFLAWSVFLCRYVPFHQPHPQSGGSSPSLLGKMQRAEMKLREEASELHE